MNVDSIKVVEIPNRIGTVVSYGTCTLLTSWALADIEGGFEDGVCSGRMDRQIFWKVVDLHIVLCIIVELLPCLGVGVQYTQWAIIGGGNFNEGLIVWSGWNRIIHGNSLVGG